MSTKIYLSEIKCILSDLEIYSKFLLKEPTSKEFISHIVFAKLPLPFRKELVRKIDNNYPSIDDIFANYLSIIKTLCMRQNKTFENPISDTKFEKDVPTPSNMPTIAHNSANNQKTYKKTEFKRNCKWCNCVGHTMSTCSRFPTYESRIKRCRELKLCFACSSDKHTKKQCRGNLDFSCGTCGKNSHITALCDKSTNDGHHSNYCINSWSSSGKTYLLPTVTIDIKYGSNSAKVRCLLDSGSQRSYISGEISKQLKIENSDKNTYHINTFVDSSYKTLSENMLTCSLGGNLSLITMPFLTDENFNLKFSISELDVALENISKQYSLADPPQGNVVVLQGLLGIDFIQHLDVFERVPCLKGSAFNLPNGISPFGNVDSFLNKEQIVKKYSKNSETELDNTCDVSIVNFLTNPVKTEFDPIGDVLKDGLVEERLDRLFEVESLGISETSCNFDEEMIDKFDEGIELIDDKYNVNLPWYEEKVGSLKSNFEVCCKVLDRVVTNLKNKNLYDEYLKVIQQQLDDDIIEQLPLEKIDPYDHVWVPHRPVVRTEEQVTTKLRLVLNCSLKIGNSPSLNECAYPGVNLLGNLFELLLKIRENKYLVTSDIKKAFLMIRLKKESDKNKFCILFKNEEGKLLAYRYKTLIFGFVSSPFILNHIIRKHVSKFPKDECSLFLLNNMYVDNFFMVGDDPNRLDELHEEALSRMSEGGFELRAWTSNSSYLKDKFMEKGIGTEHNNEYEKVLGYRYRVADDTLSVNEYTSKDANTKRMVLSQISSVFDPLSLLAPLLVKGKILLRSIWELKLGWDEILPENIIKEWNALNRDLLSISDVKFNRMCFSQKTELIVCTDASKYAYGFAAYLRSSEAENGSNLVFSKCKSAPLKNKSLPTLELLAIFLAIKCLTSLLNAYKDKITKIVLAVDSQVALAWVLTENVKTKNQFAKNRVNEISSMRKEIKSKFGLEPWLTRLRPCSPTQCRRCGGSLQLLK